MMRPLVSRAALCAVCLAAGGSGFAQPQPQSQSQTLAPRSTLERISALLGLHDVAAADTAVAAALGTWPRDPALHNFAGVIAAQRGSTTSAETHFLTAIRLAPNIAAPYTNLGRLYQEKAGADPSARAKALEIYSRLLAIQPDHHEAVFQSGLLLAFDGRFGESLALLERLPPDLRTRPQVLALTAVDRSGAGDAAGATRDAAAVTGDPALSAADVLALQPAFVHLATDRIVETLLTALDTRGLATPPVLQRLAAIHVAHGRLPEARGVLERAVQRSGDGNASVPILMDLGRVAAKQGEAKAALGYLAHARSLDPQNAQVHFLFAIVCVQQDLGAEAYESMKRALELDAANPLINYAMGAVAMSRRDPSEAIPYFEAYVRLAPADPRGRFALGAARYYSNQLDAAQRDLEAASGAPETAAGAAYYLARIARQADDLVTARRQIDTAVRLAPSYADAWAERGLIETRAGEYPAAEQSLSKALSLDPGNYDATRHLAALYGRTRDPRRADVERKLASLIERREARMQDFLRMVEAVP